MTPIRSILMQWPTSGRRLNQAQELEGGRCDAAPARSGADLGADCVDHPSSWWQSPFVHRLCSGSSSHGESTNTTNLVVGGLASAGGAIVAVLAVHSKAA